MKKAQKVLVLLIALIFCLQAPAFAFTMTTANQEVIGSQGTPDSDGPQYSNTKDFIQWLDQRSIPYEFYVYDEDEEQLVVDYTDEDGVTTTYNMFFFSDNELVAIYVWYIIYFDEASKTDVVYACNDLNASYRYTNFYVDETDNTVTATMDIITRPGNSIGDIVGEGITTFSRILSYGYETLGAFDTYGS